MNSLPSTNTLPTAGLPLADAQRALAAVCAPEPKAAGPVSLTGRRWAWPQAQVPTVGGPLDGGEPTGDPAWLLDLLVARGHADAAGQAAFLQPQLRQLADPAGIEGMARACQRLVKAARAGERVCVYGDYDVDGVCASALLADFFEAMGLAHEVYIPDRRAEGYGLNAEAIAEVAKRCQLLVTVDCGSTSLAEIAQARALGLCTIVVDHHQCGPTLPDALAVLNPHRPDCAFADKHLCATGVAFMLAVALRRTLRETWPHHAATRFDVRALLDLVAVATVADMVALRGLNRILVAAGLQRLQQAPRAGLLALMQVAGVTPAECNAADLGFRLGPRINARGRLDHAGLAVQLMRAPTVALAEPMARALDEANSERRRIEGETLDAAIAMVQQQSLASFDALVLAAPDWHPGVLGLVASRLCQRYHRPAVVVGEGGKGSARSVEGLNLHECLHACAEHMQRFGGHPAAAGLTMDPMRIPALRQALSAQVHARLGAGPYVRQMRPELEATFACMHLGTVRTLQRLAPYGRDNPEVLFAARAQHVHESRLVGRTHLKLRLAPSACPSAGSIDAIGFGLGDCVQSMPSCVDVLFYLEQNHYRGMANVQMRVVDLRPSAFVPR